MEPERKCDKCAERSKRNIIAYVYGPSLLTHDSNILFVDRIPDYTCFTCNFTNRTQWVEYINDTYYQINGPILVELKYAKISVPGEIELIYYTFVRIPELGNAIMHNGKLIYFDCQFEPYSLNSIKLSNGDKLGILAIDKSIRIIDEQGHPVYFNYIPSKIAYGYGVECFETRHMRITIDINNTVTFENFRGKNTKPAIKEGEMAAGQSDEQTAPN